VNRLVVVVVVVVVAKRTRVFLFYTTRERLIDVIPVDNDEQNKE
jgi:hypothetical protein